MNAGRITTRRDPQHKVVARRNRWVVLELFGYRRGYPVYRVIATSNSKLRAELYLESYQAVS